MLIGLTGGYCAGKNAAAGVLERRGFLCLDLDRLGHEALATERAKAAVEARFGAAALDAGGKVDRRALGALVFGDAAGLADLEAIVHPLVYEILEGRLEPALAARRDVCLNAALLYRMPEAARCGAILEVRAPLLLRLRRAKARDGLGARRALQRIWSQRSFWKRRRAAGAPVLFIANKAGLGELEAAVDAALAELGRRKAYIRPRRLPIR
ncbi:MAG: dephospho-CoA kinase [Spirochaetaceae bacterium]|nr:dephospho-CoA kinase [Spirochaetaceae bacterium]